MTKRIPESLDEKSEEMFEDKVNLFTEIERSEIAEKIEEALNCLTEKQRTTFILRHYHYLPLQEIADIMNCSVGTVKAQLFRTLKRLQVLLAQYKFEF